MESWKKRFVGPGIFVSKRVGTVTVGLVTTESVSAVGCWSVQAWSIVFHSWLSFVLLISACLIWMVPQKRQLCLRCSPVVVFYAICLVTLQYVYGFNLNDDELPTIVNDYSLKEIGLVKYPYPVIWLATQVRFVLRC